MALQFNTSKHCNSPRKHSSSTILTFVFCNQDVKGCEHHLFLFFPISFPIITSPAWTNEPSFADPTVPWQGVLRCSQTVPLQRQPAPPHAALRHCKELRSCSSRGRETVVPPSAPHFPIMSCIKNTCFCTIESFCDSKQSRSFGWDAPNYNIFFRMFSFVATKKHPKSYSSLT